MPTRQNQSLHSLYVPSLSRAHPLRVRSLQPYAYLSITMPCPPAMCLWLLAGLPCEIRAQWDRIGVVVVAPDLLLMLLLGAFTMFPAGMHLLSKITHLGSSIIKSYSVHWGNFGNISLLALFALFLSFPFLESNLLTSYTCIACHIVFVTRFKLLIFGCPQLFFQERSFGCICLTMISVAMTSFD